MDSRKTSSEQSPNTYDSFSTSSPKTGQSFKKQTANCPSKRQSIGAHARGSPSAKFVLQPIDPRTTPSWRKNRPVPSTAPENKEEAPIKDLSKPIAPVTCESLPLVVQPVKSSEPMTPKKAPVKSTGGLLLIADNLRKMASTAATSRTSTLESQVSESQGEQHKEPRRQVGQVAAAAVGEKTFAYKQPLKISKEQEQWFSQRAKV